MTNNNAEITKQINYYLSKENLETDEFFYDQVSANKEHFVDIKCFLNCNKIKKMGIKDVKQIVDAIQGDENLEVNSEGTMLRRKDLNDLPEFKAKKKARIEGENAEEEKQVNPYDKIETVIFSLSLEKEEKVPFRYIQETLLKTFSVFSPYTRFNKSEGNFALEKKLVTPELIAKFEKEGLKVGETTLSIKKLEGNELDGFWEKHGHHYNGIIDSLRKEHNKKQKADKRGGNKPRKISEFKFGDQTYTDINQIKSLFKNILCRNPNNKPLPQKESDLVKELLSYHDRGEEKLKDLKHFVVDVNPSFVDTRCLFVVRNNDTREDFSIVKCINNLENKVAV